MNGETQPADQEPEFYRALLVKNMLISKLYHFASGGTDISPVTGVTEPHVALEIYLNLTGAMNHEFEIFDTDPYAGCPYRFTAQDRAKALTLETSIFEHGVISGNVPAVIESELEAFINRFSSLDFVSETDKADVTGALQSPGLRNFKDELNSIVSGYAVLLAKSGVVHDWNIRRALESGFYAYTESYANDFHYYDAVYSYFDNLKADGGNPQEVYIGRDMIYAYLGRQAQNAARQQQGRNISDAKYLVYQRFFRDYADPATKERYLASQEITADSDPIFVDTGYTGTIAEDIMRVIGMDERDYDGRIKLMATDDDSRRLPGIDPGSWDDIKRSIDYRMKSEEPSIGLIVDEGGILRNVAQPTIPEEQLISGLIRMCTERHYMLASYHEMP